MAVKAHPAYSAMGTGAYFRGLSGRGVMSTPPLHVAPSLRMSRNIRILPRGASYDLLWGDLVHVLVEIHPDGPHE